MKVFKVDTFDNYQKHKEKRKNYIKKIQNLCQHLENSHSQKFNGYSYIANSLVDFEIKYNDNGKVNWRESLKCPLSNLNNRLRYTMHLFDLYLTPYQDSNIYITEQTTPLYNHLNKFYTNVIGSEFLGDEIPYGDKNIKGILNEDLTKLTFKNEKFDIVMSFDVLEHIPNYRSALKEIFRVLDENGKFIFSVPFTINKYTNTTRAIINNTNEIEHLLPPEYHGDPVNGNGILAFYHFGWELLDELRSLGFKSANAYICLSEDFGYIGNNESVLFIAEK